MTDPPRPLSDPDAPDTGDEAFDPAEFRENTPFGPVPVRYRHDGWVPDRQAAFIEALAESGCVGAAAKAVGMSRGAAYALRRRHDAQAFRLAWDAATDLAVGRLADAALARAIHGVAVPVFRGGEQIGERRHYNERLTMFLLRSRDPVRYGKWLDRMDAHQPQDGPAGVFALRLVAMMRAAWRAFEAALAGQPEADPRSEPLMPGGSDDARDAAR